MGYTLIEYLEKPATKEEKEVAKLLTYALESLNKGEMKNFLNVFSEDSQITSPFSRQTFVFSKNAYEKHLQNHPFPDGAYGLREVHIRVFESKEEASVSALLRPLTYSNVLAVKRNFHCVKIGERWLIDRSSKES